MKKLLLVLSISLSTVCFSSIEQEIALVRVMGEQALKTFAPKHICTYLIAGSITHTALKKFVNTPWKKENSTQLFQYGSYSLMSIGFLAWYTRTQL